MHCLREVDTGIRGYQGKRGRLVRGVGGSGKEGGK